MAKKKDNKDDEIAKRFKDEFENSEEVLNINELIPEQILESLTKMIKRALDYNDSTVLISKSFGKECRKHAKLMVSAAKKMGEPVSESTAYAVTMSFIHKMYIEGKIIIKEKGGEQDGS